MDEKFKLQLPSIKHPRIMDGKFKLQLSSTKKAIFMDGKINKAKSANWFRDSKTIRASRYPSHFVGQSRSGANGGKPSSKPQPAFARQTNTRNHCAPSISFLAFS